MEMKRTGWLVVALVAVVWVGCGKKKDEKSKEGEGNGPTMAEVLARCDQLGKACGDSEKRVGDIIAECKQAAEKQLAGGCGDAVMAAYDCYEQELCGKKDKVWALDDLRVLSERHGKCASERDASQKCVAP
jgi:hypothetical protein